MIYGLDDFIPFYKPTGLGSVLLYESICIELRTSNFGGAGGDIIGGAGGDINEVQEVISPDKPASREAPASKKGSNLHHLI